MKNQLVAAMIALITILILELFPSISQAHNNCGQIKCAETKQKIEVLRSRLRQAHSNDQGRRWKTQLRKLQNLKSSYCR